jgi:hypothetical protein
MVGRSLAERPKSMLAFRRVASRAEGNADGYAEQG